MAHEQLAAIHKSKKDTAAAAKHYREAISIREEISKLRPDNERLARQTLGARINFANFLRTSKEYPEASVRYKDLLDSLEKAADDGDPFLRLVRFGLADSLMHQKKHSDALPLWTKLVENDSDPGWDVFELQRSMCEIRGGNITEGVAAAKSVLESEEPDGAVCYDVACCYSIAAAEEKEEDQADEYAGEAMRLLRQARDEGFFTEEMRAHAKSDFDLDGVHSRPEFKEFFESLNNEE